MSEDQEFLEILRGTFLEEAKDLLEESEQLFLEFESSPSNLKLIEKIFQLYHTLKGGAGGAEFQNLKDFTHAVESLLVFICQSQIVPGEAMIDILVRCNDKLREIVSLIEKGGNDNGDTSSLVNELEQLLHASKNPTENFSPASEVQDDKGFHLFKEKNVSPAVEKNIGDILVEERLVEQNDIDYAADLQSSRLGEILVKQGKVSQSNLNMALAKQNKFKSKKNEEFIKLPMRKIQTLIDHFGEQVILQSLLDRYKDNLENHKAEAVQTIVDLAKITKELQQASMSLRMYSIKPLFIRIQKVIRDTAKTVGKDVQLEKFGEDLEIDKSVYDVLYGTVSHLVRNSVDHGVESSEERARLNKPSRATVTIRAEQKSGAFILTILDDGKGLDREKILSMAISRGFVAESANLSDQEIFQFIFKDGLSTKEQTTDISGRGVGMSSIKAAVEELKGTIDVDSKSGVGTKVTISVPLNLSVFNGTVVRVGDSNYVIPNTDFIETVKVSSSKVSHGKLVSLNGKAHTITHLKDKLQIHGARSATPKEDASKDENRSLVAIIVNLKDSDYALIVDELVSQERIVLKKLGEEIHYIKGISGGTIMGDGQVTLILNVPELIG